jgi:electron transfer flavoprotein alpha subunit
MITNLAIIEKNPKNIISSSSFVYKLKEKTNEKAQAIIFYFNSNSEINIDQFIEQNKSLLSIYNHITFFNISSEENIYIPQAIQNILSEEDLSSSKYVISTSDTTFSEVVPYIGAKYNGSIISQVEDINEDLSFLVAAFGGKIYSSIKSLSLPAFITIKSFSQEIPQIENTPTIEIKNKNISYTEIRLEEKVKEEQELKLEEAKIIVSGGRGIGGKENFLLLKELANLLNGAVGASRAAVDSGWIEPQYQIGQTGKTVSPNLYIAIGISGASQHIAGMNKSKVIVSINTDPQAPIFKYSHFGVIEDYKFILKAFIDVIKSNI